MKRIAIIIGTIAGLIIAALVAIILFSTDQPKPKIPKADPEPETDPGEDHETVDTTAQVIDDSKPVL